MHLLHSTLSSPFFLIGFSTWPLGAPSRAWYDLIDVDSRAALLSEISEPPRYDHFIRQAKSSSCQKIKTKNSEPFRTVPNLSETFRIVPKSAERKEEHILTVREAARMFEAAGVARTERSITNWCQPSRSGVARLDAYFDSNDRKYFITPQSVDAATKEELAKAAKHSEPAEPVGTVPNPAEVEKGNRRRSAEVDSDEIEELQFKLRDAEITSRAKDQYITKLETQNDKILSSLLVTAERSGS